MNPQRYLVAAGLGSRRACDKLIGEGRVTVNGRRLAFGTEIKPGDDVRVDGRPVAPQTEHAYFMLNKPKGYVSDRGTSLLPSALDLIRLPKPMPGLHAAGRLDEDATGLLLITNDGELSYRLTHPRFEHEKEYVVLVEGAPTRETLARWRAGIVLHGETSPTAKCDVRVLDSTRGQAPNATRLKIVLHEGRKRQIKRVAKALGHPVIELVRIRIGAMRLGELPLGQWRALTTKELAALQRTNR